jgi:hypothetical protein
MQSLMRLWHGLSTVHPSGTHLQITVTPNTLYTPPPFPPSVSSGHADSFGNFLRRLAFELASTFLYGIDVDSNLTSPGMSK